ncbi:hypothetical protein GL50803_0028994 [Giardia duodenalis]|uniref:Uncharacterized protein n=1 Tax=Giardia intestinalis (strain ATCC 50803 / WB clone C6) TaxID=184922 RepID=A8BQ35_GIAIC|nr:hypothetical protein GL50803_0028994 [Giardia intestinalis]KAE8304101.1 hypothetical protein GL50803_0028994 [Giardia intestinalis]|eukprot:XP_001705577.1 Hypothetical protein GL50803_28994 [Giardia lamblia ATCC 50803]
MEETAESFLSQYKRLESAKAPSSEGARRFRLAVLAQCIASEQSDVDMLSLFHACLHAQPPTTSAEKAVYDLACDLDRAASQAVSGDQTIDATMEVERLLSQFIP